MKLKKKTVIVGLLGALVVIGVWVSFYKGAEPKTFMGEVKAVRAKNKATDKVEFHDVVTKYIPAGTHKEDALKFCEANELKIYPVRDKRHFDSKTYDEAIVCSIDIKKEWYLFWTWWAWYDEVRVILDIKNDIVVHTNGFIFTHSL